MRSMIVSVLDPVNNFADSFKLPEFALSCGLNRLGRMVTAFWPGMGPAAPP